MDGNTSSEAYKRAWVKHYMGWYSTTDNVYLSPEALHSCGYLTALAGQCWDGISDDVTLMFGPFPATAEALGQQMRWGSRIDGILDELCKVGFLREAKGSYKVLSFRKWQDRPSGGARKGAGRKKKEERRKKREARGEKQEDLARFARDTDRAWEHLTLVRKQLIPGSRSVAMTPRPRKAITACIEEHGIEAALAVIDHRGSEVQRDPKQAKWLQWETIFRPTNFARTLGMVGTGDMPSVSSDLANFDFEGARNAMDSFTGAPR